MAVSPPWVETPPPAPNVPRTYGSPPAVEIAAPPAKRRRVAVLSVVAALVLVVIAAAGVLVVRPGPVDRWLADGPTRPPTQAPAPDPAPTPVLAAVGSSATVPTAAGVQAAIGPLIAAPILGKRVNISVVDAATGGSLFDQNADAMITPASTTKLLTAATVLAARGPAYRLTTRAVAGAEPGEVVLVGGGDPTLAINGKGQFPGAARLDKLADQVRKALGDQPLKRVVVDTSLYQGPGTAAGWDSDVIGGGQVAKIQSLMTNAGRIKPVHNEVGGDPRFADPATSAAVAFTKLLIADTDPAQPLPKPGVGTAPAPPSAEPSPGVVPGISPGTELGRVESPPLVHVVDWMLEQSDNVIAEAMGRQVALAAGQPASFEGAAQAMIAKLNELGLPAGAELHDASGLSRLNRISPKLLTDVLTLAAGGKHPELGAMFGGLPVAGWSGTLRNRFTTPAPNKVGQGLIRAKTGRLTGVNTIAGQLVTQDGRLLLFAIMADGTGESVGARQALDKIAARLVTCGCG